MTDSDEILLLRNEIESLRRENELLHQDRSRLNAALDELRLSMAEPTEVLRAIQYGEVDAIVLQQDGHEEIYSLQRFDSVYRTVVEECFPYGVWLSKQDGTLLYITPSFLDVVGTSLAEMRQKGQFHFLPAATRDAVEGEWARCRETRNVFSVEYTLLLEDGSEKSIWTQGLLAKTHDGLTHWVGINVDVTEQRTTQDQLCQRTESLRLSEDRFRMMADTMPQIVWVARADGFHEYFNKRWYEYVGCSEEESIGNGWELLLHADVRQRVEAHWTRALRSGEPYEIQYRFLGKDGEYRWFLGRALPVRNKLNQIVKWVGTCTDIEYMKRAEAATLKHSAQLRGLAQIATRIILAEDVPSLLNIITEEARSLIGAHQAIISLNGPISQAPISACSLSEKYASCCNLPLDREANAIRSAVCQQNRPLRMTQAELEAHPDWGGKTDGDLKQPQLRGYLAAPLMDREGRNIGLIQMSDKEAGDFVEDDEALLVQLAQVASVALENARLYKELQDADRRKDEFLATLAHELRNPLAPLRTGLDLLKLAGTEQELVDETRTMMELQLQQLVRLIDDLLEISRITQGKLRLRMESVNLAAAIRGAANSSRANLDEFGHQLTIQLPPEPIYVHADLTRLTQVFANLLSNAIKYTDCNGEILLTAEQQGDEVVVSVHDNGIGISADHLPHLFEMFSQVDSALERSKGGLGIGLALVRGLVEMHGGSVGARSDGPGKGSSFVVRLPVAEDPIPPANGPTDACNGAESALNCSILVVDDNRHAARMLATILKVLGHEVYTAHGGAEALQVAETFRPRLVLMDIGMPEMNGYEVARRFRESPWGRDMMLVAVTGWGQKDDIRLAAEAGFDRHVTKPIEMPVVQNLIAEASTSQASLPSKS
jgi:PAS domain S-box-containing protein